MIDQRTHGWEGWDAYASFYDWENARTFGRRDIPFWRRVIRRERGAVLELGCGTGRLLLPLSDRAGTTVGIDRSTAMLERAGARAKRLPRRYRPGLILGDVRELPFVSASLGVVLAPYGLLQSLLTARDLARALREAARVLRPGGLLGIDLVPDLPVWAEYGRRVQLEGSRRGGGQVTLVESVRQDRRRGLTMFDEEFVERRAGRTSRRNFTLTFRTQPLARTLAQVERAGFEVEATCGDYSGGPWTEGSDAWLILARRTRTGSQ